MNGSKFAFLVIIGCAEVVGLVGTRAYSDTIVADDGFEAPNQGSLSWTAKYQYNPTGTAWTFNGLTGVASNGSGFGVLGATNGNSDGTTSDLGQAAFIQMGNGLLSGAGSSSISQVLNLGAGSYSLNFDAEGRGYGGGSNPVAVYLYDQSMSNTYLNYSFTPVSQLGNLASQVSFSAFSDSFTIPTTGQYGLYFVGQGVDGLDVTSFVDNVSVNRQSGITGLPPGVATPLPSAAWAGVSLMGGLYLMMVRRRSSTR